ncbi:MAG: phosphate signaling complex protein PhoU [Oscillospiraceae bacterium]|nr:phosphate signaling complex protein PhoU [Oscillospiraceae bacterium]
MRSRFDEEMALLHRELTQMGALCEEAIALTAKALGGDRALAAKVPALESEIDQAERDIEALCLKLLLRQQPVAKDLRQVSAALKMITDLERVGDQANDIADIISAIEGVEQGNRERLRSMAQAAIHMVTASIDAYVCQDVEQAEKVIIFDDTIDNAFQEIKIALVGQIAQDPQRGEYALDQLMIAKYFERIGDHAVNVAEWVVFAVTGIHKGEKV